MRASFRLGQGPSLTPRYSMTRTFCRALRGSGTGTLASDMRTRLRNSFCVQACTRLRLSPVTPSKRSSPWMYCRTCLNVEVLTRKIFTATRPPPGVVPRKTLASLPVETGKSRLRRTPWVRNLCRTMRVCRSKTSPSVLRLRSPRRSGSIACRRSALRNAHSSLDASDCMPASASASSCRSSTESIGAGSSSPGIALEPDVEQFGDLLAAAQVHRLRADVAVLDVRLVVLEVPRLDDDEVAGLDPHAALHLARDAGHAGLAVLAHDAELGGAHELVGDGEHLAVARVRHPVAVDRLLRLHPRGLVLGGAEVVFLLVQQRLGVLDRGLGDRRVHDLDVVLVVLGHDRSTGMTYKAMSLGTGAGMAPVGRTAGRRTG